MVGAGCVVGEEQAITQGFTEDCMPAKHPTCGAVPSLQYSYIRSASAVLTHGPTLPLAPMQEVQGQW